MSIYRNVENHSDEQLVNALEVLWNQYRSGIISAEYYRRAAQEIGFARAHAASPAVQRQALRQNRAFIPGREDHW